MHSITFSIILVFLFGFVAGLTIISADIEDEAFANLIEKSDLSMETQSYSENILETMYISQNVGKSHHFYFTTGERKDGDKLLGYSAKQTGWKNKTDAVVTLKYPTNGYTSSSNLTYVMMKVIQESDINRIYVSGGGINQTNIEITIIANQTRYLTYNATFYGI